ncbi:MAG: tetratricopeptide repeat protein [Hyphomicrobiales bacterium]|nr:tetratricopeptide repeat protein [Hyphomicrobiales bacterium]
MKTVAVAVLAAGLVAPAAHARGTRAIATPFVVADTLAGSYLSAMSASRRNDTLAASTYLREVLRYDPDNKDVLDRAYIATLSNGDMADAFAIARRLVKKETNHSLGRMGLAIRAFKVRHFITARTSLARGKATGRNDILGVLLTAWAWQGSGKTAMALAKVDSLKNPAIAGFKEYQGALIAETGKRHDEAIKRIAKAYAASRNDLSVVLAYAAINAESDKPAAMKALKDLEKVLPRHPVLKTAIKDLEAGKKPRLYATNAIEGAAEVLYQLGNASNRRGNQLVPMIYLRLALYLAPENDLAIFALADIYENLKQHERAIDVYDMVPEKSPLAKLAQMQIGNELESLNKKDDALNLFKELVAKNPKDAEAVLSLANIKRNRKEFKEAAELYTRALDLSGKNDRANWTTHYFRAICYERTNDWPKAEADFKKALELYPDHPSILNYLGYSWVDRKMKIPEAFRLLRRAVELRPTDGAIVDSLGWAYYRLGKYDDALRELERAIELRPSDPVINDHLGDVYWKVGRKLEAGFQWNHARDLGPEPSDKVRILRKIEVGLDKVEQEEAEKKNASNKEPATASEKPASPDAADKKGG